MELSTKHGKYLEDPKDRISSLPDELLSHVLSLLPTQCAVSTSILSTRWRYLFTLTDCLFFKDGSRLNKLGRIADRTKGFEDFVYKVLELHQICPIKKFRLECVGSYQESDLNAWINNAVEKGVEELHYQAHKITLTDDLVTCETLVRLTVRTTHYMEDIEIPLSVKFPCLKILHLYQVRFVDHDSMQRLFSNCRLLEELDLDYCVVYDGPGRVIFSTRLLKVLTLGCCSLGQFEIDAPNLAYLSYSSDSCVKIVSLRKNSSSLVKANLHFDHKVHNAHHIMYDLLEDDYELLKAAASKTTELCLSSGSVQYLLKIAEERRMPDFHNLSTIHLINFPYDSWKYVTSLLDKSPRLETVTFISGLHRCFEDQESPPCELLPLPSFSCHVRVIEVYCFCGHKGSLVLLGHLLRNARHLKKLILYLSDVVQNTEEEVQVSKDLLMLPRASSDCCVELKSRYWY